VDTIIFILAGFTLMDSRDLILNFARENGINIVSDGDLDGIFASGLLLRGLNLCGLEAGLDAVSFPHPRSLLGMRVEGSFLIELPPSKGLNYSGSNLLVDHHGGVSGILLYREEKVETYLKIDGKSVAEIVVKALRLELSSEALLLIDAVGKIDQAVYDSKLVEDLHKAYRLEISSPGMRVKVSGWVYNGSWRKIMEWASKAGEKWSLVEEKEKRLYEGRISLCDGIVYFTYDGFDPLEQAAMRGAMFRLEDEYKVVVAVRIENGRPVSASIGTKGSVDLQPLFSKLESIGLSAGGRTNIGGVQISDLSLEGFMEMLRKALLELGFCE